MRIKKAMWMLLALAVLIAGPAWTQQQQGQPQAPRVRANPDPNCTSTPQQEEANLQLVINPPGNPNDRIDPSYKHHNPAFIKGGREAGLTDYAYFMQRFGGPGRAGGGAPAGAAGGRGQGANAAPQPPPGNPNEIVVAQCDMVVVIHMNNRQDPTAPAGTWFQAFTFDAWRVRNGKIVEHWDSAVINPPAPAAQ